MITESSQKPNPRNTNHGLTLMKRAIKEHGTRAIDRRSRLGKALTQWQSELITDLGGIEQVSTQQKALVDLCVRTKLLLDSLDAWLLAQGSLVNARKKSVYPALLSRTQLSDSLARYLGALGLQRRAKPGRSLGDLLSKGSFAE
jgi:hypothetical protein